jgi:hypothetical protein
VIWSVMIRRSITWSIVHWRGRSCLTHLTKVLSHWSSNAHLAKLLSQSWVLLLHCLSELSISVGSPKYVLDTIWNILSCNSFEGGSYLLKRVYLRFFPLDWSSSSSSEGRSWGLTLIAILRSEESLCLGADLIFVGLTGDEVFDYWSDIYFIYYWLMTFHYRTR